MRSRLLSGWSFFRVLWLVMGMGMGIQAVTEKNLLMLLPAIYFVFAAIANVGCFAGSCATNLSEKKQKRQQKLNMTKVNQKIN